MVSCGGSGIVISVLMCTYNRAHLLSHAIESVLNQTYKDLELIIIDDGSTDGTENLIRANNDCRIVYKKLEKNSFYCYAANYGLTFCRGEYLAFMNSDDIWLPDKLEKQIHFLEVHKEYKICFTAAYLIDAEGNDVTDQCPEMRDSFGKQYASQKECIQFLFKYRNTLCHPSALVRKEMMTQVGGFNLMFCQLADYDLWLRMITEGPIYVLPERLIQFRWDMKKKDQISIATKENSIRAFNEQVLIKKHLMERLSDENLIEFFGEQFRNKNSRSHLELEFERAFLLMDCLNEARGLKVLGMEKLEHIMQDPKAMHVLREHFGLDIFELYAWNKANMYQTPWAEDESAALKTKELQLTINHYQNLLAQSEQEKQLIRVAHDELGRTYEELQQQHAETMRQHVLELELTTNHHENLMAQLEQEKVLLQNAHSELERICVEEQQRHALEKELTENHYQNLMAQQRRNCYELEQIRAELQRNNSKLLRDNEELQQILKEKDVLIQTYANSTSWKITEPFRKVMRLLKNKK